MKRGLWFLFLLFVSSASVAEEPKVLEEHEWPNTCKTAVRWLVDNMDETDKKAVRETSKGDLIKHHHGWGTGIRNNFGLWRGNNSLMKSCLAIRENEEVHPDSVSMIIIEETWVELNWNYK